MTDPRLRMGGCGGMVSESPHGMCLDDAPEPWSGATTRNRSQARQGFVHSSNEVPMRILHVVTRLGLGGAERVAETLASGSVARGDEAALLTIVGTRDHAIAGRMRANLAAGGVELVDGGAVVNAKVAVVGGARRLALTVERLRPDVVHLHTEIPEFAWALASSWSRRVRVTPVVRTIHNTRLWDGWPRAGRFAERRLLAAALAAVSHAAQGAFEDWRARSGLPAADSIVIYNGVELAELPLGPRQLDGPPHLLFAARFEPQKGIDTLLDSIARLTPEDPPFMLSIHGAGSLEGMAAEAVRRRPDRLVFGPPLADLRSQLASFDAVVMPSRFEGLGLLAVEALCSGVPVLATDAPGLAEVLPADYPGRSPAGDAAAFAEVIRDYLRSPGRWQDEARRAQPGARARFAVERMIATYAGLYRRAMSAAD